MQAASPAIDVDTLGSTKVDVDGIFERSFRRPTKGLIILSANSIVLPWPFKGIKHALGDER